MCWIHLGAESNPIISRTWAEMDAAEDAPARVHNLRKARRKYNPVKLSGRYMYMLYHFEEDWYGLVFIGLTPF